MTRARETSENERLAKAWVNFDGTFGTSPFTEANGGIRSAFNVSSVTDIQTGWYQVNFTNIMQDNAYVAIVSAKSVLVNAVAFNSTAALAAQTTSSLQVVGVPAGDTSSYAGQRIDTDVVNVVIF